MTLYLIAHKVRGEPAFDIATKMEMADGPWWIIPTSGHRAYPFWHEPLDSVLHHGWEHGYLGQIFKNPPADLRDHYETTATAPPRPSRSERADNTPRLEDL